MKKRDNGVVRCLDCGKIFKPVTRKCPDCGSGELDWVKKG